MGFLVGLGWDEAGYCHTPLVIISGEEGDRIVCCSLDHG